VRIQIRFVTFTDVSFGWKKGSVAVRSEAEASPTVRAGRGGKQDDGEEHAADHEVEALAIDDVDGEGLQEHEDDGAEKCAERVLHAAEDGDDQDVDQPGGAHRPGRDQAVVPDEEDAADAGDEAGQRVRRDPVRDDSEAERVHPARVVADALQRLAERRPDHPADEEVAGHRAAEREEVERHRIAPGDAEHLGRVDLAQPLEAVEDAVVLQHQVVEGDADRQRDHDRVDAFGANREPADQGGDGHADQQCRRQRRPPGPAEADLRRAAVAEHRQRIAGDAGDGHLREGDHAAVAAEEGQRERDQAEHQRLRGDLEQHEGCRHQRQQEDGSGDDHVARPDRHAQTLQPRRRRHLHVGHPARRARRRRRRLRQRPHGTGGAGIHRPPPLRGAHADTSMRRTIAFARRTMRRLMPAGP
jgi:hypothetical protein